MKGLQAIGITIATAEATLVEPVDFHLQPGQPLTLLGGLVPERKACWRRQ
ncbi:hypothetical protein LZ023_35990 (plasmid) [Pseudomonas silvicola]|nr:hypothetical protein LZ023_35990 [Pseudomonas silvicola]